MTTIEVFADMCCPFTHVGLRRFVEMRADRGRPDVRLWVRAWPLEIVNEAPLDPRLIAEEVDEIREAVAPDLFEGFAVENFPRTSLPAFALAAAARNKDSSTGEAVNIALRDTLFEHGRDISDPRVLGDVAEQFGLVPMGDAFDTSSALADHEEGRRRGVIGSPYFFTPGGSFFCPALDISREEDGHLRITADTEGFDEFLGLCFASPDPDA